MKQTTRRKMQRLAMALAVMAFAAAVADADCVAASLDLKHISWDRIFRTHPSLKYDLSTLKMMAFVMVPSMVAIFALGAWTIFKHLDDIPNEKHDA